MSGSQPNVEALLAEILKDIARVLVVSGYGIANINRLAKYAYLEAAQDVVHESATRTSKARIAALTGLTRTEVSRLTRLKKTAKQLAPMPLNRAQRVTSGWVTDSRYCDEVGRPRQLPFSSHRASFESLVKLYSGDIPARAMLLEMTRLGMAAESPNKSVRLIRSKPPAHQLTVSTLGAIRPWTRFLADVEGEEDHDLRANTARIYLTFDSLSQLFSAVRELQERGNAFVSGIRELGNRRSSRGAHRLKVSIAIATRVPKPEPLVKRKPKSRKSDG